MTDVNTCTVVIPTYNREKLLRYTLDSLARQTLPADQFEVLVVDDGSQDSTADLAAAYAEKLRLRYFFRPDEGYRVARARNVGIAEATGDICVFVDSGVLLESTALAVHLERHRASAAPLALVGYVYCFNMDNAQAEQINRTVDFGDPDGAIAQLRADPQWPDLREQFYEQYGDDFGGVPAPWLMYWTCHASARTEQLRRIGKFDEWFTTWGGEDVDLAYRLHRDGARFALDRRAGSIHCPHDKVFETSMELVAANYRHVVEKYADPIVELLTEMPDPVHLFNFNEVIHERGLAVGDSRIRTGPVC